MLEPKLKSQLVQYLSRLMLPVRIEASINDEASSRDLLQLLEQVTECSSLLSLKVLESPSDLVPSFSLHSALSPGRVRFAGLPLGHEFTSLVLALLQAGGHPPKLDSATLDEIQTLGADLSFESYISLSCQLCPDVVQTLNLMALVNPRIKHTMIDGSLFQAQVADRKILAVPAVYLNGVAFSQGSLSIEEILAKLDTAAVSRSRLLLDEKEPYEVLVIGAGPAGVAAAVYAARKGIRTGLVAERVGGQLLDTLGVENFISIKETQGAHLVRGLEEHAGAYEIDVIKSQTASSLSGTALFSVALKNGAHLAGKSVILATGARWREMNVPGEKEYRNRGVAYCPHCDGPLFKNKSVAVIGGGNSGVEAAIDLAGIVSHVTLLEYDQALRADAVLQRKLASLSNATIITNAQSTQVLGNEDHVTGLKYRDRTTGETHELTLAGIFVQIGLIPNTDWLKGTLVLSARGEIEIDSRGQTSLPGVFAAGDCTTVPFKQIVIAVGEGAKAALSAFDYLIRAPIS